MQKAALWEELADERALEIAALSEQQDAQWEQAQAEADSASPYSYAVSDQKDKELATLRDQRDELLAMLTPLKEAVLFARAQRRPLGIGQDFEIGKPTVTLGVCPQYGRETDNPGFHLSAEELGPEDADGPSPTKRIALALLRLAYVVAEKVKPRK